MQRPDVIDRSIFLQLRSIAPSSRRRERELWAEFTPDYPRILGGLLDAVAAGMRLWSEIHLPELERMADFTHWGEAVAQGAGWPPGTFVQAYRANRQAASFVSLEESLLAQALLQLAKYHGPWKGTMTQFLELIGEWTGYAAVTTPGWPKNPSVAAFELRASPLSYACPAYPSASSAARREKDLLTLCQSTPMDGRDASSPSSSAISTRLRIGPDITVGLPFPRPLA